MANDEHEVRPGHDSNVAGKQAECDGGGPLWGTRYAGRQEFTGTLTGNFVDHGDPPWRWYQMVDLVRKPDNYSESSVWCEADSLFLLDDPNQLLAPGANERVAARRAALDEAAAKRKIVRSAGRRR